MVFLRALSVFFGTVIGVGIFGLPFVALKAGFLVTFTYFLIMAFIVILVNFLYAEVVLGTEKIHRLPGYVGQYLSKKWKKATFFIIAIGVMGALLAYLIIGGEFLSFLLAPYLGGSAAIYTLLFFGVGSYLLFRGIKSISQVELFLFGVFLVILILFFIKAFPLVNIDNFKNIDLSFITFPYGVILFSLWGAAVIPEIKEMLARNMSDKKKISRSLKGIVLLGVAGVVVIYLLFIFIVLGVSGLNTSEEAISGLGLIFGENIVKLGFIFGIITCFTSFLTLGLTLKKSLWYDFGFSQNKAWLVTCLFPLIFFFLGVRKFIEVIGFTGAVALGLEGMMIIFLYNSFLKKKFSKKMSPLFFVLILVFAAGIVLETFYFLFVRV